MRTVKFHKTECGVDFLINVLPSDTVAESYLKKEIYDTDYLEIVFFKKGKGRLHLNHCTLDVEDNSIFFISPFQKREWDLNLNLLISPFLFFRKTS